MDARSAHWAAAQCAMRAVPTAAQSLCAVVVVLVSSSSAPSLVAQQLPDVELFFQAASREKEEAEAALAKIAEAWKDGYASMLIDIVRFLPSSGRQPLSPTDRARARLLRFLEKQTGEAFG